MCHLSACLHHHISISAHAFLFDSYISFITWNFLQTTTQTNPAAAHNSDGQNDSIHWVDSFESVQLSDSKF